MRFVNVVDCCAKRGYIFVANRPRLIEQRRNLFTRRFALLGSDAQVKTPVTRPIRTPFAFDVERDDASTVVQRDAIDERHEWRLKFHATNPHEIFLNTFRVVDTFYAQLIVNAEDNHAAAGVGERADFLRDLFGVREFYFEFEVSVFTAADQSQEFGARCLGCGSGEDVFLKRTLRGGFVSLVAAKSSTSHLCIDGALNPPGCCALHHWN